MSKSTPYVPGIAWIAFLASALLFLLVPSLDLGVSALFYTPGDGFRVDGSWYERVVYRSVEYLLALTVVGLILAWLLGRFTRRKPQWITGKELGFLLLLLTLGPGLIINLGLKENWGRVRPVDVVELGGTKQFTPAFVPSDQDGHSFPSGHAGSAFYLAAVAFVIARRKRLWVRIALEYGVVVSFFRVAAGGHFLSDTVTAFFIDLVLFFVLYRLFFGRPPTLEDSA